MSARAIAFVLLLGLLLGAVIFAPSGGDGLWIRTLHNFAHGPIFGCVALLGLLGSRDLRWFSSVPAGLRYAIAFAFAAGLGAATELAQVPTGRDASWSDLGQDLLGAGTFLLLFATFDTAARMTRATRAITLVLGLLALALLLSPLISSGIDYARRARGFPVIADFTRGIGIGFISTRFTSIDVLPFADMAPRSDRHRAMRIRFLSGTYPGIEFTEPPPDWRGYNTLVLDVANSEASQLDFVVRIDDEMHNGKSADRYNHTFHVPARSRASVKIPLSDVKSAPRTREFDLSRVDRIIIFRSKSSRVETMYLIGMRLE
jgi:hypothetical protein